MPPSAAPPRRRRRRPPLAVAALAAALGLGACGGRPDLAPPALPDSPALSLGVSGMEVQDQVQGLPLNFIDRRRTDEMVAATRQYLGARFVPAGGAEFGRAVIEEASLVERPIPRGGITGAIAGPARELVGALAVRIAVADGLGVEQAYARARVELKRGVSETSSVLERDVAARGMMTDLLAQLDRSLEAAARENLATYLAGT